MRLHFLTITFFIVLPFLAWSQGSKQIASRKIKTVHSVFHEIKKGVETKRISIQTFDKKGRLLESSEFNADSVCISTEKFTYDRKDNVTEHAVFDAEKGAGFAKEITCYDRWGRDTLQTEYNANGELKQSVRCTYNTFDDKTSETTYDAKNQITRRVLFTYDKRGMLLTRTTYNAQGEIISDKTNRYTY